MALLTHRIVKSGMDFYDLSEVVLDIVDTPTGSVRKKVVKSLQSAYVISELLDIMLTFY